MLSLANVAVIPLLILGAVAQCNTDQNPYCRGNDQFEAICCPYPNVCYWADRQGTPGCCAAGSVCLDRDGAQVQPQPVLNTPAPAPAPEPTTIYTTQTPTQQTQTVTQQQPTQQTVYTTQQQQPTQHTVYTTEQQPPATNQQPSTVIVTNSSPGPVEGVGSTVAATASSVLNVFEGAAPTARPARCAAPVAGALALAAWHMG